MMHEHMWVSFQYTPVEVAIETDGSLTVTESIDGDTISKDQAMLGCWFCHAPLSTQSFDTNCVPESA